MILPPRRMERPGRTQQPTKSASHRLPPGPKFSPGRLCFGHLTRNHQNAPTIHALQIIPSLKKIFWFAVLEFTQTKTPPRRAALEFPIGNAKRRISNLFPASPEERSALGRPGSDLLSRVLRRSTIGAEEFNGRVRNGIGFRLLAITTRPAKAQTLNGDIRT